MLFWSRIEIRDTWRNETARETFGLVGQASRRTASKQKNRMPQFFFHLSFGNRRWPDEEGVRLHDRAAARSEAEAIVRELAQHQSKRGRTRWAGWFIRIEDASGEFLAVPLGHPSLALVPKTPSPQPDSPSLPLGSRNAELARQMMETMERLDYLLHLHRQLRRELAVGRLLSGEMRHRSEQLRVSAMGVRSLMPQFEP
jgi:hypothetical protein